MFFNLAIVTLFLIEQGSSSLQPDFDKNYVGVVYEPYTKYHDNRHDYTLDEVKDMMLVVSKRFKWISTYGMGTISGTSNWSEGQAGGFSGVAASQINKELNALSLVVNLGTWLISNDAIMKQEVANAFTVANLANTNFPGTVNGVIITSHHTYSPAQVGTVVRLLTENLATARNLKVQLGLRTSNCDALTKNVELINLLDFINCQKFPTSQNSERNVSAEVGLVGQYFLQVGQEFGKIKLNLTVIGETGWASFDKSSGQREYNNSVRFWLEMGEWAKNNKFRVDMFTAFDEPWKKLIGAHEPHYGWWERVGNESSGRDAFREKLSYLESEPAKPTSGWVSELIPARVIPDGIPATKNTASSSTILPEFVHFLMMITVYQKFKNF